MNNWIIQWETLVRADHFYVQCMLFPKNLFSKIEYAARIICYEFDLFRKQVCFVTRARYKSSANSLGRLAEREPITSSVSPRAEVKNYVKNTVYQIDFMSGEAALWIFLWSFLMALYHSADRSSGHEHVDV